MPVPCELRSTGPQDRCKSARGPDADLRRNILIYFISEGSRFGVDSHPTLRDDCCWRVSDHRREAGGQRLELDLLGHI